MAANPARAGSDGQPWPGYAVRSCPVCCQKAGTHRNPVQDRRGEVVQYHQHRDAARRMCVMVGKEAALSAVAFTGGGR